MKKLLQINICSNVLSTGKIMEDIGNVAMANEWESYVAYGRSCKPSNSYEIKIGRKWDVYEHLIEARIFDNCGLASKRATRRFVDQIEKLKPDVIHLHNIHGYYLNYPILFDYLKRMDVPVVWTLHDCWAFTGHCGYFVSVGCDKWEKGCHSCQIKHDYPKSWLIDNSAKNYELKKRYFNSLNNIRVIAVSHWLENLIYQSFLGKNPIYTIYNGVDTNVFQPKDRNIDAQTRNKLGIGKDVLVALGVASSWTNRKGLDDFAQLQTLLNNSADLADKIQIVMVGLTDKQIASLPSGIIGLNRTTDLQELALLYSTADVVLNLSSAETFGLTTVEGYACGTPCIGYNSTATPELMVPETGFVVEEHDLDVVAESLKKIMQLGKLSFSEACRLRALTEFDKNKCFKKYIDLYNSLLKNKL